MKRVYCLYRVSTQGQVDHNDIPMQRIACRAYAEEQGWTILREVYEKGVSGYKVGVENRDAIQELKEEALLDRYDILLVFMFDRLGRREDETPFVVEWFVKHNVEVWSVKEGQQRFDTHVDKLMNYIRYWQASGESEKTAIRVRTRQHQIVKDGFFRGGRYPYGYKLEYMGRLNKKNQPVHDLVINTTEAETVRLIFDLIGEYHYSTRHVATYLNSHSIPTRRETGLWQASTINIIVRNTIYIGRQHIGNEISEPFENYRIVEDTVFYKANRFVSEHANAPEHKNSFHLRTLERYLLNDLLYCGDCGFRMYGTTTYKKPHYSREVYRCGTNYRQDADCNGQRIYTASRVEETVEGRVKVVLDCLLHLPATDLVGLLDGQVHSDYEQQISSLKSVCDLFRNEVDSIENKLIQAIQINAPDEVATLNDSLIRFKKEYAEKERELRELIINEENDKQSIEQAYKDIMDIRSGAANYDLLDIREKKRLLRLIVEKVTIRRGYEITIQYRYPARKYFDDETVRG